MARPEATESPTVLEEPLYAYTLGLAASFGISHIAPVHAFFTRTSPRVYPLVNVCLPFGRCLFLLAIVERLATR